MKQNPIEPIINEMEIETTMRNYFAFIRRANIFLFI